MPSIFAQVGPSPLAGTLFRIAALGSVAIAGSKLILAPTTTSGLADQPLSDATAPAKASKLSYYQNAGWYLMGALVQLRWSYTGIHSVLDQAVFGLLSLQYLTGGIGFFRLGFSAPAAAFATGLVPMLGALLEN
ncbi:hypothetical protein P389DRAFT_187707 [Cystobasidium minutum MCA 4210]|uniref:uncharacterized protein n=1 Tax=Cystobasidium minutum MCA 4210 TaxID=1397322 RepID=UPI0034CD24CE|eukprot:jgi/Rhomi1/187707/estExt_fgenesh1_pg.C_1_t30068